MAIQTTCEGCGRRVKVPFGRREILEQLVNGGLDVTLFQPVIPSLEEIFIRVAGVPHGTGSRSRVQPRSDDRRG